MSVVVRLCVYFECMKIKIVVSTIQVGSETWKSYWTNRNQQSERKFGMTGIQNTRYVADRLVDGADRYKYILHTFLFLIGNVGIFRSQVFFKLLYFELHFCPLLNRQNTHREGKTDMDFFLKVAWQNYGRSFTWIHTDKVAGISSLSIDCSSLVYLLHGTMYH